MKATVYATDTDENRDRAIEAARQAVREKKTLVIPTDTVYGIAADAFSPRAVAELLAAKGRSRTMPPPVLIFDEAVLPGLADEVSAEATALAREFWPGALTLILYSQPSLTWDLGDSRGTVALRVPRDSLAIDLLRQTGPLAVSSANKTGREAATSARAALEQLGDDVELIIDGGHRPHREQGEAGRPVLPSTIVDCTSDRPVVVREGAISVEELRVVVPGIVTRQELEAGGGRPAARHMAAPTEEDRVRDAGPRASAPQEESLSASLVTATGSGAQVDQVRTRAAYRREQYRRTEQTTKPVSIARARSLVFGGDTEDGQASSPS